MRTSEHLAKHIFEVYFGKNWTAVNFQDVLGDVSWQEANTKIGDLNTIATLVYHSTYYFKTVNKALQGEVFNSSDEESFKHPEIKSETDWQKCLEETWREARLFSELVKNISDEQLNEYFVEKKYGSHFRNINGIIEHSHYHLGQIVVLKKLIRSSY